MILLAQLTILARCLGLPDKHGIFITGPHGTGMKTVNADLKLDSTLYSTQGINDSGQLVGALVTADGTHAAVTGADGAGVRDLGTLGGESGLARAINNAGQVVGRSTLPNGFSHAFITNPNGIGMKDLGTIGVGSAGIADSDAWGVNESGQVVGKYLATGTSGNEFRAFIPEFNGTSMRDLGTPGESSQAYAIMQ
jgi:probable HAF family extracellular repeat protein